MSDPARPAPGVLRVGEGFWNLRGSFKVAGLVEIGTHVSLVRRASGKFVLLDGYTLSDAQKRFVDETTNGGADLEAVIHVHPFHTLHVQWTHDAYPDAAHYGTARHHRRFPSIAWQAEKAEDAALHRRFADDLAFTVPRGVDFISANESLHFSSVLVLHRASRTLHVDDTLMVLRLPKVLSVWKRDVVTLHPTLSRTLEPRPGAAADFRAWGDELLELAKGADNLCTAHSGDLLAAKNPGPPVAERIATALQAADGTLKAHEKKHG
jgi:hypothetical protein